MKSKALVWMPLALSLAALACSVLQPAGPATEAPPTAAVVTETAAPGLTPAPATTEAPAVATPTNTVAPAVPTDTVEPPTLTPTLEPPALQFIAYVDPLRQLLVTNVTGNVLGGTTQYTSLDDDIQVLDLVWSPSGEFIAFSASMPDNVHIFYVYAVGAGTPVDLGIGSDPAWSPDSTRLAFVRDNNLWQQTIEGGPLQQLTFNGSEWAWSRPLYAPAGDALIDSGARYDNMGAQGNTSFWFYRIPLDGSGTPTQLPGQATTVDGRLARDLTFSPDAAHLAFSTSWHLSACASEAAYYVMNADGSDLHTLISPALAARADPDHEIYFLGFEFAWTPAGDGLLQSGLVRTCADFSGDLVGDPQVSVVNLSGAESSVIVGQYDSLSFDRSGAYFGAVLRPDFASPGEVHIYDLTGSSVLTVGPGDLAAFQP